MIRRFCDACGDEIERNYVSERLTGIKKFRRDGSILAVQVEVTVGTGLLSPDGPTWNKGDLCIGCVIDTVTSLDPRPQAATQQG